MPPHPGPFRAGRLKTFFWSGVIVVSALEIFVASTHRAHSRLALENMPFFGAVSGAVGALLIFLVAKVLGKLGLSRKEDYYD